MGRFHFLCTHIKGGHFLLFFSRAEKRLELGSREGKMNENCNY